MSRPRQYPTEIFVTIENEGQGDDEFYQVNKDVNDTADLENTPKRVGRYLLAEILSVRTEVVVRGNSLHCHESFKAKR